MIPLSIVILSQNEEQVISRCVKSISWSPDILIIDNSTDKTLDYASMILTNKSLRIVKNDTNSDFSLLRNLGLKLAIHDWVLFIDADEIVTPQLCLEIQEKLRNGSASGYYFKRVDYFLGSSLKFGETAHVKLLKLGKKSAGKWVRKVHEVWKIKGEINELNEPLLHFPHPTVNDFVEHIERWTTLDAKVFHTQGVRTSFIVILIYPIAKFFLNYVIRLGFLDGMPGLIMATMMSFHSFLTRAKLYLYQK